MAETTLCSRCRKTLMTEWSLCPYCGQVTSENSPKNASGNVSSRIPPADSFPLTLTAVNPFDADSVTQNSGPGTAESRRDTTLAGIGLVAVGATGSIVLLRTLTSMRLSIDAVLQIAGLLVMVMIVGIVLAARGKSPVASILSGIIGGVITVLMAALIGILIFVSFILYLFHDCLRMLGK